MIKYNSDVLKHVYRDLIKTLLNEVQPNADEWSITFSATLYVRDGKLLGKTGSATINTYQGPSKEDLDQELDTLEIKLKESGEWEIPEHKPLRD